VTDLARLAAVDIHSGRLPLTGHVLSPSSHTAPRWKRFNAPRVGGVVPIETSIAAPNCAPATIPYCDDVA
jgi:hypothetical protein